MQHTDLATRLEKYLAVAGGATAVRVCQLERLPGGASRETWGVEVEWDDNGTRRKQALVLRRDPPGTSFSGQRRQEFELLRLAAEVGVPVPRVLWCEDDPAVLGAPFFLMEKIVGETLPRRLLRDAKFAKARERLPRQLALALAAIHSIQPGPPTLASLPAPPADCPAALGELDRLEQLYRTAALDPHPVFELAFRWLRERAVPEDRRTLVHGDFRTGNFLFDHEGLVAVLDWELAHLGDPIEDIGWLCVRSWRFGNDHLPVGGLADYDQFLAPYDEATGFAVDRHKLRYWEVFGNLRWGIITILQTRTHIDGMVPSVELASLGRRTAEVEFELLSLLKGARSQP